MPKQTFSVDTVMSAWKYCVENLTSSANLWLNKKSYRIGPHLRMFYHKGTVCKVCGIQGTHFEEYSSEKRLHLRLVTHLPKVYMTIDHTIPRSVGGRGHISNLEPLCTICNNNWKSNHDKILKKILIGFSVDDNEYLLRID